MTNTPFVSLENVNKFYHRGSETVHAVEGANLQIYPGEYVALLGESGSGKTTLLNIMGCLDNPTEGVVKIDGIECQNFAEKKLVEIRRTRFGFVFQQFFLIPTLTVEENIILPTLFTRTPEQAKKVDELLDAVGLTHRSKHLPGQLSGGEMQRVAIARSLINSPEIIFADEPTGNLDSKNTRQIMDVLENLNKKGITIVMVTHNRALTKNCTREVHIEDGKIKI